MSGLPPKHGLYVTVNSGPSSNENAALLVASGAHPLLAARDRQSDSQPFTRSEIVSIKLGNGTLYPFAVLASIHTPGAILIESVQISICEEDEPVCSIPIFASSVLLKKPGDSQVFRPTDRQFATVSEHVEHGNALKVTVQYLAAEQSELKISIIRKDCHHKLLYGVAMVGLGFAVHAVLKHFPGRSSASGHLAGRPSQP